MHTPSRPVSSPQAGVHPRLYDTVARHLRQPWRAPLAEHNQAAYRRFLHVWDRRTPLILDAGCGVGLSTQLLARRHPDHFVLGVDQSHDRLVRAAKLPPNALLLRADLADFWRLLASDGVPLAAHWLLYPNPWPKSQHLQRRWHGHAVLPYLLQLGGQLELRCNWAIYAAEFAAALRYAGAGEIQAERWVPASPLSRFEHKYQQSGHALWRVRATLAAPFTPRLTPPTMVNNDAPPSRR